MKKRIFLNFIKIVIIAAISFGFLCLFGEANLQKLMWKGETTSYFNILDFQELYYIALRSPLDFFKEYKFNYYMLIMYIPLGISALTLLITALLILIRRRISPLMNCLWLAISALALHIVGAYIYYILVLQNNLESIINLFMFKGFSFEDPMVAIRWIVQVVALSLCALLFVYAFLVHLILCVRIIKEANHRKLTKKEKEIKKYAKQYGPQAAQSMYLLNNLNNNGNYSQSNNQPQIYYAPQPSQYRSGHSRNNIKITSNKNNGNRYINGRKVK